MPRFSIIVVHYQGTVPHDIFLRGIESLRRQTYRDFEILCYHDGPLLQPFVQSPIPIICTERRFNDFGHSLRDRGLREARGDYIVHFNADNILYPQALETVSREIDRPHRIIDAQGQPLDTDDIIIFPILMHGLLKLRGQTMQTKGQDFYIILTGSPPTPANIDCMQLVMKRELWIKEGGWHDKRPYGDGIMYDAFCKKYGHRYVGPVLGEHF